MTYIPEICKLLGVELNETFNIGVDNRVFPGLICRITPEGLQYREECRHPFWARSATILESILIGNCEIIKDDIQ